MKLIGAVLIVFGCGAIGIYMAGLQLQEERFLKKLIYTLDFMSSELQYRLTPLPDLCSQAAHETSGPLKHVLLSFSEELNSQICPDVNACMSVALSRAKGVPDGGRQCLKQLGASMGRFDLAGQIQSIDAVRTDCRSRLDKLEEQKDVRLRTYKTLGFCVGVAVVILFM